MTSGVCGVTLSRPLKLDYKPVTRVENYCATGSEAFRNACYAVASGAYDIAMAIGVEKLKDTGYSGLTGIRAVGDGTDPGLSSPAAFSFLAPSYAHKYGVDKDQMKEVMSRIAFKNHQNGARNPRAQFQKEVSHGDDRQGAAGGRRPRRLRLQRRQRRLGRGHHLPGRGRPQVLRQPALREGAGLRGRPGRRPHRPRLRLHHLRGGGALGRRRLRARPGSPTRGPSWPWPRCTTASRRPSSSSWRTWASPSGARRGRRCWRAPSTATASCRSTPTAA